MSTKTRAAEAFDLLKQGREKEARALLEKIVEDDLADAAVLETLGDVREKLGDKSGAIDAYAGAVMHLRARRSKRSSRTIWPTRPCSRPSATCARSSATNRARSTRMPGPSCTCAPADRKDRRGRSGRRGRARDPRRRAREARRQIGRDRRVCRGRHAPARP